MPLLLFAPYAAVPEPNLLRFRMGTADGVTLTLQAKQPGELLHTRPVGLDVDFPWSSRPATTPTNGCWRTR